MYNHTFSDASCILEGNEFLPWENLSKMNFLVGHGGVLVALFICDNCVETFHIMGRLVLSFNTALAAPIWTGYKGIGAGVLCYHFDASPHSSPPAFSGEVCLQLCGTPHGLFTKGAMAGSLVLLHPTNTRFAERAPAVKHNHWLQHQGITKTRREHGFRVLWVFAKENQRNSRDSIRGRKEKQENCWKRGKMRPTSD